MESTNRGRPTGKLSWKLVAPLQTVEITTFCLWVSRLPTSSRQVTDFDVDMTAYHKGHFILKACAISPGQMATQACFDWNLLRLISGENAKPHPNYPNGAHMQFAAGERWSYQYKFQLPQGLSGDLVLLQWHNIASNSCLPPGYNTYNWSGWNPGNLGVCVDIPLYGSDSNGIVQAGRPGQFWNCAEVRITNGTGGQVQSSDWLAELSFAPSELCNKTILTKCEVDILIDTMDIAIQSSVKNLGQWVWMLFHDARTFDQTIPECGANAVEAHWESHHVPHHKVSHYP